MDIVNLITEVSFPIFIAAYLLVLVTRKITELQKTQDLLLIYLGIILAEHRFNLHDPSFANCVQVALEMKEKNKEKKQ